MSDRITQALDEMQELTCSSPVPLGVSVARHVDRLLAETRLSLRTCIAALRAVLAVVERDEEIVAHNDGVPITRIGELIARPLPREYRSAIESALRADS